MNEDYAVMLDSRLREIRDLLDMIDDTLRAHLYRDDPWLNVYVAAIGGQDLDQHSPEEIARHAASIADAACNEYRRRQGEGGEHDDDQ